MTTHGFDLLEERQLPELNSLARLYRHAATGAELLSLLNEDENKLFCITFRTPPTDSTGLPHILEHSVLCGSRKYPSKEPFVELMKGSLNTFLNAFTAADRTMYPVASQNLQDFYNLVDVYLDAVFYPRITPQTLQQEGWHYELENPTDPLIYKGVVFNEMKGANGSPERQLYLHTQQALLPDTTYGVDSGGDPAVIPNLTYKQFKSFHESYYHPSNARIFCYGDDDPSERLRLLDAYLSAFERAPVTSEVALQAPFRAPQRLTHRYPVSEQETGERKGMVVVGWMLGENSDPHWALVLQLLDYILLGTPGSPLRKALIESGLGEDIANYGLEPQRRQIIFSTGLKGVAVEDAERIEALILDTLRRLADEGIERESIEAALNSIEFNLRENNSGAYPRGLTVLNRALPFWTHGGNPLVALAFEAPLAAIRARLATGEALFETLIRDNFLTNSHRVTLVLEPDPTMSQQIEATERARLDAARAAMSEADIQQIIEETRALKLAQETPDTAEAKATIPSLDIEDLDKQNKPIPLALHEQAGSRILYHDLPTNGITYLDLGMDLHQLPQELLPYAPLFGRALLEMGTEREDFVRLSQRIDRKTGGIRPATLTTVARGKEQDAAWLLLRGKAMVAQVPDLLDILHDILHSARLDNADRFLQMALEEKAGLEASLLPTGHRVINRRLRAHFTEADWANEQLTGVSQLFFVRRLVQAIQDEWATVRDALEQIRQTLLNRHAMLCNVTVDSEGWERVRPALDGFLAQLPTAPVSVAAWVPTPTPRTEGLIIPARINFVGKAANLAQQGHRVTGADLVVARYLGTAWLWDRVRVQGGAYGGFSSLDRVSGTYSFLSYRDPNLSATLDVYDRTPEFLRALSLSQEELTKAIIGTIGDFDSYQLPDAKGITSMERTLAGISDEERQRLREEILATTAADFRAFADTAELVREHGHLVIMGAQATLEAANQELPTPLELQPVL